MRGEEPLCKHFRTFLRCLSPGRLNCFRQCIACERDALGVVRKEECVKANHRSRLDDSAGAAPHLCLHSWRFLDLFRNATSPMLIRAGVATAVAWVPLAIFSAFQGMPVF